MVISWEGIDAAGISALLEKQQLMPAMQQNPELCIQDCFIIGGRHYIHTAAPVGGAAVNLSSEDFTGFSVRRPALY